MKRLSVVVPGPFDQCFDYLSKEAVKLGCRVKVSFGRRKLIGVVVDCSDDLSSTFKLKEVEACLDEQPIFEAPLYDFIQGLSQYHHEPLGLCFQAALPVPLRAGKLYENITLMLELTAEGQSIALDELKKAPKQQAALAYLKSSAPCAQADFLAQDLSHAQLNALIKKGWVNKIEQATVLPKTTQAKPSAWLKLNEAQQQVFSALKKQTAFSVQVLMGVTGSGKTEVYCHWMQHILAQGKQALVLVPEIGLTPQMFERFESHFDVPVLMVHSMLTDTEKHAVWVFGGSGKPLVVVGTRSALFVPLPNLGLIIVDEEHDASFKQQSAPRYHGRDMAVLRAQKADVPILLGSATPSLETYYQVQQGKYSLHELTARAGGAGLPAFHLIDMRQKVCLGALSDPLIDAMKAHIKLDSQVMLFLNRRGYSHALICHDCGWAAKCKACDAFYTLHLYDAALVCHHCGHQQTIIRDCVQCHSRDIIPVGAGTEKIEETLRQRFPNESVLRVDRDVTQRKGVLQEKLKEIHDQSARLIVGTQMLAKGHHFENLNMVGIVDVDTALFSSDFRALERLGQLILQVAGRAGRGTKSGEVYLQTHQIDHPTLRCLLTSGYRDFADKLLEEREACALPPYTHFALIRAEAKTASLAKDFLEAAKEMIQSASEEGVTCLGPVPALQMKKRNQYRSHLFVSATSRRSLHQVIKAWRKRQLSQRNGRVKWSCEIDPYDLTD